MLKAAASYYISVSLRFGLQIEFGANCLMIEAAPWAYGMRLDDAIPLIDISNAIWSFITVTSCYKLLFDVTILLLEATGW